MNIYSNPQFNKYLSSELASFLNLRPVVGERIDIYGVSYFVADEE